MKKFILLLFLIPSLSWGEKIYFSCEVIEINYKDGPNDPYWKDGLDDPFLKSIASEFNEVTFDKTKMKITDAIGKVYKVREDLSNRRRYVFENNELSDANIYAFVVLSRNNFYLTHQLQEGLTPTMQNYYRCEKLKDPLI